jgi:hypothetical protein
MRLDDCTSAVHPKASIGTKIAASRSANQRHRLRLFDHLVGSRVGGHLSPGLLAIHAADRVAL